MSTSLCAAGKKEGNNEIIATINQDLPYKLVLDIIKPIKI